MGSMGKYIFIMRLGLIKSNRECFGDAIEGVGLRPNMETHVEGSDELKLSTSYNI